MRVGHRGEVIGMGGIRISIGGYQESGSSRRRRRAAIGLGGSCLDYLFIEPGRELLIIAVVGGITGCTWCGRGGRGRYLLCDFVVVVVGVSCDVSS